MLHHPAIKRCVASFESLRGTVNKRYYGTTTYEHLKASVTNKKRPNTKRKQLLSCWSQTPTKTGHLSPSTAPVCSSWIRLYCLSDSSALVQLSTLTHKSCVSRNGIGVAPQHDEIQEVLLVLISILVLLSNIRFSDLVFNVKKKTQSCLTLYNTESARKRCRRGRKTN